MYPLPSAQVNNEPMSKTIFLRVAGAGLLLSLK